MKEILENLFKERTIDSGALGREIIFENEFDDMIEEIVKLCNLRIVSKQSELLIAFLKWRKGEQLTSETITEIDDFLADESNL